MLLPDSNAAYWVPPFTVQNGLRITVSGKFPDSRYFSLDVYDAKGGLLTDDDVGSGLTDYRIQPDPGSINHWQRAGRTGGSYTVNLTSQVTAGQADTLPLAPAGTTSGAGYFVYRVYLPFSGHFSTVPLPSVLAWLHGDGADCGERRHPDRPQCASAYTVQRAWLGNQVLPVGYDVVGLR